MATTAMSTYSRTILVKEGLHPPVTCRVNGASELYPGYPVTNTGHTWPDVGRPDGLGDVIFGVAGLLETNDIGTAYSDNDEIPVYMCGSGAIVRMYHGLDDGSITAGDIVVASSVDDDGHIRPLSKALADFTADGSAGTILATQIKAFFSIIGRAIETHASSGTTTPIKVLLSV